MSGSISKEQESFNRLALGEKGLAVISTGESSVEGETFCAIYTLEDSTVSFTASNTEDQTDLAISEGGIIYGLIKTISVTSGKVIAYKR